MCTTCGCPTTHTHNEHLITIEQDILSHNNAHAEKNRQQLHKAGIFTLNLVSSPGAGKTSLLERTINDLNTCTNIYVIEGDQQTTRDAERIRHAGAHAHQINTGKGCHLDASMIDEALTALHVKDNSLLFIENVGNLVCPAAFDLGEDLTVAILSVTEGDDKPLKYPDIFYAADVVIISKIDLLPYVDFNIADCIHYLSTLKQYQTIIQLSIKSGHGLNDWYQLLRQPNASTY